MAIKDLRKQNEGFDIKEIKKQAFIEAYETILAENVVMTEEELKNTITEAVSKVKEEFKKALGEKFELVEEAIKNESQVELFTKTELVEEFDSLVEEAIGKENFETLNRAIKEGIEVYVLDEEEILEAEDRFVEAIDEKIKEAIGEENFEILEKAIKENEEVYVLSESIIPTIEEKMRAKIKEELEIDEASVEDDAQETLRQQIIANADLYAQAKEAEDINALKEIVCAGIEDVDCDVIDWEQLLQDLQAVDECKKDEKEEVKKPVKTLAEKLIDEGIDSRIEETEGEEKSLAEKLI